MGAVELVEHWPQMSPTVGELARRADASERTLRSVFVKYLGMPPYQYLIARRLNHARQLLLESDSDELSVREVAAKVGFWDFGRFAGKYRRLFGELPSETLRRKQTGT
jgi:AraC family ethanolamine operon transcriptional activator